MNLAQRFFKSSLAVYLSGQDTSGGELKGFAYGTTPYFKIHKKLFSKGTVEKNPKEKSLTGGDLRYYTITRLDYKH